MKRTFDPIRRSFLKTGVSAAAAGIVSAPWLGLGRSFAADAPVAGGNRFRRRLGSAIAAIDDRQLVMRP